MSAIVIVVGFLACAYHSYLSILLGLLASCVGAVATSEFYRIAGKNVKIAQKAWLGCSFIQIFAFFWACKLTNPMIAIACMVAIFGFLFVLHFKDFHNALVSVAVSCFAHLYIPVSIGLMLCIIYAVRNADPFFGLGWFLFLLIITKMTDICAYFIGKLCGRHPLAPNLSPKKTIEGSIAGFLGAALSSLVIIFISRKFHIFHFYEYKTFTIILACILGVVSQFGDLAESLLKRDANVKDSSNLPGLGGVLDMLDSLLFTAPVLYVAISFI